MAKSTSVYSGTFGLDDIDAGAHHPPMRALIRAAVFSGLMAAPVAAQSNFFLSWKDVQVGLVPDSTGLMLFIKTTAPSKKVFVGSFDPASVDAWLPLAASFMVQTLSDSDTGVTRISAALPTTRDAALYLARRKRDGRWTNERLLAFQPTADTGGVIVNAD